MKQTYRLFAISAVMALGWSSCAQAAQPAPGNTATGAGSPTPSCELHIYPTRNFQALSTGWLVGLGPIGGLAEMSARKGKVKTVKQVMADILTPDIQMTQLGKVNVVNGLKLPADTIVTQETPLPSPEEAKSDAAAKTQLEALEAKNKDGTRLTASTASCYGELLVSSVFYQKAAMYGTRIFTFFTYRKFEGGKAKPQVSRGQVEQHTPGFPASTPEGEDAARTALIDAFGADFVKWSEIKLKAS